MRPRRVGFAVVGLVALVACFLLKRHYSTATPDELRWVLAPTTAGVSFFTGASFAFDPAHGYVSGELRYVIAPVCAGVNFLIIAFASLLLGFVRPSRSPARNGAILVGAAVCAYATTIVANTARITVAIALRGESWGWLTPARIHVLAGVVVYLAALLVMYALARRTWSWVPLVPYAGVALVVPLLNGAGGGDFWAHAGLLVGVMLAAVLLGHVLRRRRRPPGRATLTPDGVRELRRSGDAGRA